MNLLASVVCFQNATSFPAEVYVSITSPPLPHAFFVHLKQNAALSPDRVRESCVALLTPYFPHYTLTFVASIYLECVARMKSLPSEPLIEPGLVRVERHTPQDPIVYAYGPVLDDGLSNVCDVCRTDLEKGIRPLNALANGFWVRHVPPELSNLTFVEQLLIARVRTDNLVLVRDMVMGIAF